MEKRTNILNELKELNSALSGMEKVNVFTVPAGYFEQLTDIILAIVKNNITESFDVVTGKDNVNLPEGYFDTLADTILNKIKAQQAETSTTELHSISSLLSNASKTNVFKVPQGYFDILTDVVLNKIKTQTASEELRNLSPMLYSIQNENVYQIPQDYFNELPDNLLHEIQPAHAKVVTMQKRTVWLKYAVAAAFTGIMAFGAVKFFNLRSSNNQIAGSITKAEYNKMINTKVDEELANITDADIVKYLQNNGENVEASLVANTIDENELPSREDYLNDDKALDKYLDNINLEDLKN